jgi:hypothetical protein
MHRSGTSVLTHLLSRMGCHAGSPESLAPGDAANARGYWERVDAVALDERILAAAHASWWEVADLDLGSLADADRRRFAEQARDIVASLDEHRPWVLKDPRLCVVLPLWRPALSAPMFVLIHRHPLETARSLQARDGFPLAVGIALWEVYNLAALRYSLGAPRLRVSYDRLSGDPRGVAASLAADLAPWAPGALVTPAAEDLAAVVDSALHHQRARPDELDEHLNASQRRLRRALDDASALAWEAVPPCSAGALDTLRCFAAGERERLTLSRHAAEREAELSRLSRRDAEISRWNETLTARLAEEGREASRLAAAHLEEVAGLTARLDELSRLAGRLAGENQARHREVAELRSRLSAIRSVLGETVRYAEQFRLQAGELDGMVAAILRSRSWRLGRSLTAPARWGRRAILAESRHASLRNAAESLAAAARPLVEEARRIVQDEAPETKPGEEN